MNIKVIVKPDSRKTEILDHDAENDIFHIAISKPAENNKANLELIKFLSKLYKAKVSIITGKTSKKKLVRIQPVS